MNLHNLLVASFLIFKYIRKRSILFILLLTVCCNSQESQVPTGRIIYPDSLSESSNMSPHEDPSTINLEENNLGLEKEDFLLEEKFLEEELEEEDEKKVSSQKTTSSKAPSNLYQYNYEEDMEEAAYTPGSDLYFNLQQYGYSELNVNTVSQKYKQTPLMKAASWGDEKAVVFLLQKGAHINLQDKIGRTALHLAIWPAHTQIVKILLENGANLSIQDNNGNTPLHIAVLRQNANMVKLLIEKGAPIDILNNKNETPLDIARRLKNQEIVNIILKKTQSK